MPIVRGAAARDQTRPVRVVLEAGSLQDGRRTAGIGRYVDRLTAAMRELDDRIELHLSVPAHPGTSEHHGRRYAGAQPPLVASVLRWRPAVVHAVTSEPVLGFPLGRQVVTVHDVVPWVSPEFRRRWPMAAYFAVQRLRLRRCPYLITPSAVVGREAAEALGVPPSRIVVIPEGVDAEFSPTARDDDGELRRSAGAPSGPYLLWVGSLRARDPRKALEGLVEAVALMSTDDAVPPLVLAGVEGQGSADAAAAARRRGVDAVFTGWVPDATLAALYRGASAVVLPSLHEGFGLTLLEAMACGAPAVVSRAGNLPDLAADAALVVEPGDVGALRAGVEAVLSRADLAQRLRCAGPTRARDFSWRRAADETASVYEAVARGRGSSMVRE